MAVPACGESGTSLAVTKGKRLVRVYSRRTLMQNYFYIYNTCENCMNESITALPTLLGICCVDAVLSLCRLEACRFIYVNAVIIVNVYQYHHFVGGIHFQRFVK